MFYRYIVNWWPLLSPSVRWCRKRLHEDPKYHSQFERLYRQISKYDKTMTGRRTRPSREDLDAFLAEERDPH